MADQVIIHEMDGEAADNCGFDDNSGELNVIQGELEKCLKISNYLLPKLVNNHDCGWFDGGCYTLADAVCELTSGTEIYHISRSASYRDHAVVRITGTNLYFDADGLVDDVELFRKMREEENVNCEVLEKFSDFHLKQNSIFNDIKEDFLKEFSS